jgi:hypothetical protein
VGGGDNSGGSGSSTQGSGSGTDGTVWEFHDFNSATPGDSPRSPIREGRR